MAVTIDIDDVISEWGAFYQAGGQNLKDLKAKIYKPCDTEKYFKLRLTDDTVLRNVTAEISEVLQSYQDTFTPKGNPTFKPVDIPLFQQKIDWKKNPGVFVESWLGFLAGDDIDRAQWPFIKYLIEELIMKRREEDKEDKAVFLGEYAAPVPGTAGAAEDAMDGIRKIIRNWNTASRSNAIATGALETVPEDFVTQLEDFVASIPVQIRRNIKNLFIDKDLIPLYKQGKRVKYNQNWGQSDNLFSIEDYPNVVVTGLESMAGSEMIWTSVPENMVRAQKRAKNYNVFRVESAERQVSIFTDWHEGLGFYVPELIYHNDQDLA